MDYLVLIGVFAVIVGLAGIGIYMLALVYLDGKRRSKQEENLDDQIFLHVRIPRDNEYEIPNADQMFSGLYSMFKTIKMEKWFGGQTSISFEIVAFREKIKFYVVCSSKVVDLVERQILGAYPTAEVVVTKDYNLFLENGFVEHTELRLSKDSHLPIVLHDKLSSDPMNMVSGALSKIREDEGIAIQYVISPSNDDWRKAGRSVVKNVEKAQRDSENKSGPNLPQEVVQGITDKISKIGFDTTIRIISVSKNKVMAKSNLSNVEAAFQQFNNPQMNKFSKLKLKKFKNFLREKSLVHDFVYRVPPLWGKPSILNTAELATVFHFPNKKVETPHIEWLMAKKAPADETVASKGLWLGTATYRGIEKDVAMANIDDRRRHMYIIGQTGTGKSKFMDNMALQDIYAGHGVCFIDPHGEEVDWLLERIPAHRAEDVIYWNPGDFDKPFGFNILENRSEEEKHLVVNAFYKMIQKLFDPNNQGITGPLLERAIRMTMLSAMAKKGSTMVEVMKCLLLDWDVINDLKTYMDDPLLFDYWDKEIPATPENRRGELMGYFTSKLDRFISNKMMRNMIGQSASSFDFREIMDSKKILLINLSKGRIGAENSEFLGLLLIPRILSAAMSRIDTPAEQRKDFFLYVDEFQNFATEDFATILSEARKFRLNLIVANQYIGQMREEVRNAVFGNVGSIMSFRVGLDDAEYLEGQFSPVFNKADLTNIENQNAYLKLMVEGKYPAPFSIRTTFKKWPQGSPQMKDLIIQISRNIYGRDRTIVEEDINRRMHPPKVAAPQAGVSQPKPAGMNPSFH